MSRVFAYCRVSTTEQVTENQVLEIKGAGFALEPADRKLDPCFGRSRHADGHFLRGHRGASRGIGSSRCTRRSVRAVE